MEQLDLYLLTATRKIVDWNIFRISDLRSFLHNSLILRTRTDFIILFRNNSYVFEKKVEFLCTEISQAFLMLKSNLFLYINL